MSTCTKATPEGATCKQTLPFTLTDFKEAILSDTDVSLGTDQLAKVLTDEWLLEHGSPYPQDKLPRKCEARNFRFICYRWLAYWVGETDCREPGKRLDLTKTRELMHMRWPDTATGV